MKGTELQKQWDAWITSQEGVFASDPTSLRPIPEHRQYLENRLRKVFLLGADAGAKMMKEEIARKFESLILS